MIVMEIIVSSLLVGIISAKPVESDQDYRQFQTSDGNSYSNPVLSGGYGVTQGIYSGYPAGYVIPQPAPISPYLTSFGFQGYGGGFGIPGFSGFPNLLG